MGKRGKERGRKKKKNKRKKRGEKQNHFPFNPKLNSKRKKKKKRVGEGGKVGTALSQNCTQTKLELIQKVAAKDERIKDAERVANEKQAQIAALEKLHLRKSNKEMQEFIHFRVKCSKYQAKLTNYYTKSL